MINRTTTIIKKELFITKVSNNTAQTITEQQRYHQRHTEMFLEKD